MTTTELTLLLGELAATEIIDAEDIRYEPNPEPTEFTVRLLNGQRFTVKVERISV